MAELASVLPKSALLWQLSVAREIILSGFQQDLYATHERPISYWYTAQVIELHLSLIDEFQMVLRHGNFKPILPFRSLPDPSFSRQSHIRRASIPVSFSNCATNHVHRFMRGKTQNSLSLATPSYM